MLVSLAEDFQFQIDPSRWLWDSKDPLFLAEDCQFQIHPSQWLRDSKDSLFLAVDCDPRRRLWDSTDIRFLRQKHFFFSPQRFFQAVTISAASKRWRSHFLKSSSWRKWSKLEKMSIRLLSEVLSMLNVTLFRIT